MSADQPSPPHELRTLMKLAHPLAVHYGGESGRSVRAGIHNTVTRQLEETLMDVAEATAKTRGIQPPDEDLVFKGASITGVVLEDNAGWRYNLNVLVPLSKTRRQYKATIRLHGEYWGNLNFEHEMDIAVFFNLEGHRGGFVTVAGIFNTIEGYCGSVDGKPFRITEVVLESHLNCELKKLDATAAA